MTHRMVARWGEFVMDEENEGGGIVRGHCEWFRTYRMFKRFYGMIIVLKK